MMTYTDDGFPLIHDGNFRELIAEGDAAGVMRGYNPAQAGPFGSSAPASQITRLPRSTWADHMRRQEAEKSSPFHWFQAGGVKVLNQGQWGYCWMYGLVGAMQTAYAMTGQTAPHLNAHFPAWLGKRGRNEGGWAGEALKYIAEFGVPEMSLFSGHPTSRELFERGEVQANAEQHKVVEFGELPRNDYEALVSVLLDPINPRPVTMGLNWWGHLIYAVRAVRDGILIVNSWGERWGQNGLSVLAPNRSVAFEQIAVERVAVRSQAA
jgi:hypothetical protein